MHEIKLVNGGTFEEEKLLEYSHHAPLRCCRFIWMQDDNCWIWEIWVSKFLHKVINMLWLVALTTD
jgi:hypothetical protein